MKKICIAVLTGIMALSVCACSNTEPASGESTEESQTSAVSQSDSSVYESSIPENPIISKFIDTSKLDEKTRRNVIGVLSSDSVELSASGKLAITGGISIGFDVDIAKDGENVSIEAECAGKKIKTITNADGKYTIDDDKKTASLEKISNDETSEQTLGGNKIIESLASYFTSSFGLDSIEYKGNGNEEYNGKVYDFEEYTFESGTIKAYYDGDTPVYFVSTTDSGKESVITVNKLNNNVDKEIFNVPSGYEVING